MEFLRPQLLPIPCMRAVIVAYQGETVVIRSCGSRSQEIQILVWEDSLQKLKKRLVLVIERLEQVTRMPVVQRLPVAFGLFP